MSRTEKTILFLHPSSTLYGADMTLLQLIKGLDKQTFKCIVVLPKDGSLADELQASGASVFIINMPLIARGFFNAKGLFLFIITTIRSLPRLKKIIKDHAVDLIHSNTLAVFSGAVLSPLLGVKHLWHVHEIILKPKLVRTLLPKVVSRTAHIVVANSNQTASWFKSGLSITNCVIKTIFNGTDNERFNLSVDSSDFRKELHIGSNEIVITMIGRINRLKGQKVFAHAAELILGEVPDANFVIVGDPPLGRDHFLNELEESLSKLNRARRRTRIIPYRHDIEKVYAASDIIVIPSTEPESFGLVAVEAMAMKKPIIASRHGGLLDIVEDGLTGILVKPNDERELASAVLRLINDEELRKKMGSNGFERQQKLFAVDRYVKEFTDTYISMITN